MMTDKMREKLETNLAKHFAGDFELMGKNVYRPITKEKNVVLYDGDTYVAGGYLSTSSLDDINPKRVKDVEMDEFINIAFTTGTDDTEVILNISVVVGTGTGFDLMLRRRFTFKTHAITSLFTKEGYQTSLLDDFVTEVMDYYIRQYR